MVWQEEASVIVMLTKLVERGQVRRPSDIHHFITEESVTHAAIGTRLCVVSSTVRLARVAHETSHAATVTLTTDGAEYMCVLTVQSRPILAR